MASAAVPSVSAQTPIPSCAQVSRFQPVPKQGRSTLSHPSRRVLLDIMSSSPSLTPTSPSSDKTPSIKSSFTFTSRPVYYHAGFTKTADSDVLLETAGGWHFATQQLFLRAASSVFRDTLLVGSDSSSESDKVDGLPVIKLAENNQTVQRFLAMCQTSPHVHPTPVGALFALDELLTMCDKYDAPHVGRWAACKFFPTLEDPAPMDHIAVALLHSQYDTRLYLENAICDWGASALPCVHVNVHWPLSNQEGSKTGKTTVGQRVPSVADIGPYYLQRMAIQDVVELSRIQLRVLQETKYDYKQAANDFMVHGQPKTT